MLRVERESSSTDPGRKLAAVRTAVLRSFPAPEIEEMLAEIEQGDSFDHVPGITRLG